MAAADDGPDEVTLMAQLADRAIEVATPAEREIVRRVNARFEKGDYGAPVLPATHLRVLEITNKPSASIDEISKCVRLDAVVAKEVISLVNSAAFMPAMPIRDLNRAIVHVGLQRVRSLMLGVSMHLTVFRKSDAERGKQLWTHSLATGVIAREIAKATHLDVEETFLAGLLHDIGKIVLLGILSDEERRVGSRAPACLVWKILEESHTAVGERVAKAWHLSGSLAEAIANHHRLTETSTKSVAATALADDVCRSLGIGIPQQRVRFTDHPAFEILGLSGERGPDLVARLPLVLESSPELKGAMRRAPAPAPAPPAR